MTEAAEQNSEDTRVRNLGDISHDGDFQPAPY